MLSLFKKLFNCKPARNEELVYGYNDASADWLDKGLKVYQLEERRSIAALLNSMFVENSIPFTMFTNLIHHTFEDADDGLVTLLYNEKQAIHEENTDGPHTFLVDKRKVTKLGNRYIVNVYLMDNTIKADKLKDYIAKQETNVDETSRYLVHDMDFAYHRALVAFLKNGNLFIASITRN